METTPALDFWWRFAAMLALETSVIVLMAFALQSLIASAVWRRTIWQACALGVLTLLAVELSGGSRVFAGWMKAPQVTLTKMAPEDRGFSVTISELPEPPSHSSSILAPDRTPHSWWPGILWLAGSALLIGRMLFVRVVFLLHRSRRRSADDRQLLARVHDLSVRLRIRRRVRVFEIDGLRGPIAFGTLRPAIGLPKDFSTFTSREQDAMLIHELAHLAARDPVWYSLVDILAAFMWWHPIIWWVRRRLHVVTEAAADESCVLLEDGPNVLAEALVQLGGRLLERQRLGLLGIGGNGFRSDLGRRVERLLRLNGREWRPVSRIRSFMARTAGPLMLVGTTLCCCAWIMPPHQKMPGNGWDDSLAGRTLAVVRQRLEGLSEQETAQKDAFVGSQLVGQLPNFKDYYTNRLSRGERGTSISEKAQQRQDSLTEASFSKRTNVVYTSKSRQAIYAKLQRIRLDSVMYENVPLSTAVKSLSEAVRKRDPQGQGIDFVISSDSDSGPPAPIDPATGLPVIETVATPINVSAELITIMPPLTDVTLSDALDAIVKAAGGPLKYSVEEYAIVFSAKSKDSPPLYTRTFKVDSESFSKALEDSVKSTSASPEVRSIELPVDKSIRRLDPDRSLGDLSRPGIRHSRVTSTTHDQIDSIRQFFGSLGVDLAPPKAIFWSDRRGMLMVRATLPELTNIEKAIQTINLQPPNLAAPLPGPMRHKVEGNPLFPELPPNRALVSDYSVARAEPITLQTRTFKLDPNTVSKALKVAMLRNTNKAQQVSDLMREHFKTLGVDFAPPKSLFWNDRLGMLMVRAPLEELDAIEQAIQVLNVQPPQVTIEVKIAEMPEAAVKQLGLDWLGTTVTATISTNQARNPFVDTNATTANYAMVLTDPQYRMVLRALEQRTGVDVLTLPKVTTLGGRQTQIKTVNIKSVVTGTAEKADQSGVFDLVITQHECGPIIDAVPVVRADGYAVDLTVITTSREFLGYESTRETVKVLGDDGKIGSAPKPLPEFRVRQAVATPTIWDGQTLAMGMGKFEGRERVAFVTVTIIDPAGNRVHSEDDGEFRTRGIPQQRKVSEPNLTR